MAMSSDDELLKIQIRHYYNLLDREDCQKLGIELKCQILPGVSKEFDRTFTIPAKEIDFGLLFRSGYQFVHRPYFAMPGCTRDFCEINPYTKRGVDAGKEGAKLTPFADFLKLFNYNT